MCQKKCHFRCSKFLKHAKFALPYHTIYGKKDPDLLYILYLACCTNHTKIDVFKKYFSRSLMNMYDLICSSLGILINFTFLLSFRPKKNSKNSFLPYFAISDAFFDPIWHKLYYQHKICSLRMRKKPAQHLLVVGNVSKMQFPEIG